MSFGKSPVDLELPVESNNSEGTTISLRIKGDCDFQGPCLNPVTNTFTNLAPYVAALFNNSARLWTSIALASPITK